MRRRLERFSASDRPDNAGTRERENKSVLYSIFLYTSIIHTIPFPTLRSTTQRKRFKISSISRDRQDPQRVRVSKATSPALHSDNCGPRLDQAQGNSIA
jgi:hypothetical protein